MELKETYSKKPLLVDEKGIPYGTLSTVFKEDLRLKTRDLDPNFNIYELTQVIRERFHKHVIKGWKIKGRGKVAIVDRAWIRTRVNKTLANQ